MQNTPYYKWLILSAMLLLIVLINLDYIAVNMALVVISNNLDPDLGKLQWLLSGYVLAWAAFVIPGGRITDRWGQKKGLLLGICFFTLASLVCGVAPDANVLIFGRVLQGVGGGLFVPPLYALIMRVFPEEKRGLAIGMLGVSAGIGLAAGPTFGALITELLGWRWIFFSMIPFGLTSFLVFYKLIEKDKPSPAQKEKFDMIGALLLMVAMVPFMYALNEIPVWGFFTSKTFGFLGLGIAAFLCFLWRSFSQKSPLIPFAVFKPRAYTVLTSVYTFVCLFFTLVTVLFGLYLQNVKDLDPVTGSYYFIAFTLTFSLISPFVGNVYNKWKGRFLMTLGFVLIGMSSFCSMFLSQDTNILFVLFCLFLAGAGLGVLFPAGNTGMLKHADQAHLTTASAVFNMATTLGCALGVIFGAASLVGISQSTICESLTVGHMLYDYTDQLMTLSASTGRDYSLFADVTLKEPVMCFLNDHFMHAFSIIMAITGVASFLMAGISFKYLTKED